MEEKQNRSPDGRVGLDFEQQPGREKDTVVVIPAFLLTATVNIVTEAKGRYALVL